MLAGVVVVVVVVVVAVVAVVVVVDYVSRRLSQGHDAVCDKLACWVAPCRPCSRHASCHELTASGMCDADDAHTYLVLPIRWHCLVLATLPRPLYSCIPRNLQPPPTEFEGDDPVARRRRARLGNVSFSEHERRVLQVREPLGRHTPNGTHNAGSLALASSMYINVHMRRYGSISMNTGCSSPGNREGRLTDATGEGATG